MEEEDDDDIDENLKKLLEEFLIEGIRFFKQQGDSIK